MHEAVVRILLLGSELAEYRCFDKLLSEVKRTHFQLIWCEKLDTGLVEMISGNYDVALLDYQHRIPSSQQLLREAVDHNCDLPIIAITAERDSDLSIQAVHEGAVD